MSRWLPAMLDQRVGRMRSSKLRLLLVRQVKIIDGKDYCRIRMWGLAELFGKCRNLQENRKIRHAVEMEIRNVRYNIDNSTRAKDAHREPKELKAWFHEKPR